MNWKILKYLCGSGFLLIILTENAYNFKVKYILSELKNILGRALKIFIEISFIFLSKLLCTICVKTKFRQLGLFFVTRLRAELKDCFMTYCRASKIFIEIPFIFLQKLHTVHYISKQGSDNWGCFS